MAVPGRQGGRRSRCGSSRRATAASSACSTVRTSCSAWLARSTSPTSPKHPRARVGVPYDLSLVEGSITTPADAERIQQVRQASKRLVTIGACATAGGVQALRNFGDVKEFMSVVYARPEYISTLAQSTPISAHVAVDFELRGCPIDRGQLLEVITVFLHRRRPNVAAHTCASSASCAGTCA